MTWVVNTTYPGGAVGDALAWRTLVGGCFVGCVSVGTSTEWWSFAFDCAFVCVCVCGSMVLCPRPQRTTNELERSLFEPHRRGGDVEDVCWCQSHPSLPARRGLSHCGNANGTAGRLLWVFMVSDHVRVMDCMRWGCCGLTPSNCWVVVCRFGADITGIQKQIWFFCHSWLDKASFVVVFSSPVVGWRHLSCCVCRQETMNSFSVTIILATVVPNRRGRVFHCRSMAALVALVRWDSNGVSSRALALVWRRWWCGWCGWWWYC